MGYQITLCDQDQELLKQCLLAIFDYKKQRLSRQRFRLFESWAESFARQLIDNQFTVNDPTKNSFTWFIDQINHSGDLANSDLAQVAREICRAASRNPKEYRDLCQIKHFQELFKDNHA